jgi:hypothetical protein
VAEPSAAPAVVAPAVVAPAVPAKGGSASVDQIPAASRTPSEPSGEVVPASVPPPRPSASLPADG